MLFNSYLFVLLFLPATLVLYFALNHFKYNRLAKWYLFFMSLWFYGYFNSKYLLIMISSILFNYMIYISLKNINKQHVRRLLLLLAVVFNIGILFYFKYFNFLIDNINYVLNTNFVFHKLILPLGISFFTFQQLSFVIDSYKCKVPKYGFLDYALFVTYFPQLIAGPIVTHDELVTQFMDKSKKVFNWDNFSRGLYMFSLGMAKKVIIADTFGNAVNWGFSHIPELDATNAFVVMLCYTIQIYFDFSGYCDMAIGIGSMMNIELPLNFNSPYKSLTILEFWNRWHMTLTRFFTQYIYIPMGGNRKGKCRTYLNTMVVFLVSGLWHGANWTFILWGGLHGAFSIITKHYRKFFDNLHPALNWIITFSFVNVTWVLFRADSLSNAALFIKQILSLNFSGLRQEIISCFNLAEFQFFFEKILYWNIFNRYNYIFFLLFLTVICFAILGSQNSYEKMKSFIPSASKCIVTVFLTIWCVLSFTGISTFLYFNF